MVRYADDLVVLCPKGRPAGAWTYWRQFLEKRLRLTITRKTRLTTAQNGFDFLGVHFRKAPGRATRA